MYPAIFTPSDAEPFILGGETVLIPKCVVHFDKWTGAPIQETFGGKPLVCFDDKPMFAELAIMNHFVREGWEARWVETYGKAIPIYLAEWKDDKYRNQIHSPFPEKDIDALLADIAEQNANSYAGCWDVVAYKEGKVLLAESKRTRKDRIRMTQVNWLAAALRCGLQPENFLVVQWDFKHVN